MSLVLYSYLASPPDRATNLLLKAAKISYERREVNTVRGDQYGEDFQKVSIENYW